MTILYHHRSLADGAEGIHITEIVEAFRELGHQVHVRGLAVGGQGPSASRRNSIAWVRRLAPRALFELAAVLSNVVDYVGTRRALRELRPRFVYKRHARYDVGAGLAARHAGVPLVLEVNCLYSDSRYRAFEPSSIGWIDRALERWSLRLASFRLAVSSPLAARIAVHGGVQATVMPNGANPRRFDPAAARGQDIRTRLGIGATCVVGWSGVIREWHDLDLLAEAVSRVPSATLLVVGDGPARPRFEEVARRLGIEQRVIITGRRPHDEMPDYVAAMDMAVVASDRTGVASPMKLLEYMAMGRAVVAPRLDNILDIVQDGHDARLFRDGDVEDLADALRGLSSDAATRERLGANARRAIETARNWTSNAERVIALIEESTRTSPDRR